VAATLTALHWLAHDPVAQAAFWGEVLGAPVSGTTVTLPGFDLAFVATDSPKTVQARVHLDLTSTSPDDQQAQVDRVLRLGGRHVELGQDPSEGHVVLADPEGNELCVIEAGNRFLADTARVGAVNCDGTHELGVFWSRVLAWPLVWDQGEETAVQSPGGGSKVTWSGTPLMERESPQRVTFHVTTDHPGELEQLGARPVGEGRYLDPDGNAFLVTVIS
jgi:catechol 2,3-dioxygenase-like lactoylglutathione lyase family enzyme